MQHGKVQSYVNLQFCKKNSLNLPTPGSQNSILCAKKRTVERRNQMEVKNGRVDNLECEYFEKKLFENGIPSLT